jgi:excisionase family DNA binding protein
VEKELLSPAELAAYLGVPLGTIYGWRYRGEGPEGLSVGRHVRYRRTDVEAWLESRRDKRVLTP